MLFSSKCFNQIKRKILAKMMENKKDMTLQRCRWGAGEVKVD